jgi:hypothetical protein
MPEDLDAYAVARAAERPPAGDDWRTVRDLMRAAEVSRAEAYRLLKHGVVPFKVFAGVRYIRGEDVAALARNRKTARFLSSSCVTARAGAHAPTPGR